MKERFLNLTDSPVEGLANPFGHSGFCAVWIDLASVNA
jgi:hypothetical protein